MSNITHDDIVKNVEWDLDGETDIIGHYDAPKGNYTIMVFHSPGGHRPSNQFSWHVRFDESITVSTGMSEDFDRVLFKAFDSIETHHKEFGTDERPTGEKMLEMAREYK